jgi:uncharacterized membrane-anchored protein
MVVWLLSLNIALMRAQEVTLAVSGYDPRDLLSGHYLRYQIDYGMTPEPRGDSRQGRQLCACLSTQPDGIAKASWFGECSGRPLSSCSLFIKGVSTWDGMQAGIERYYIPERHQNALAQLPKNATIKVRVAKSGTAYVTDMYVGSTPLLEWAESQGKSS